ncbi:MAG: hypothetical protein HJJLKODD_01765 [Phycisphaerae bacterium]|nr:hypothetical protein [Phycisphaerae bacterium]
MFAAIIAMFLLVFYLAAAVAIPAVGGTGLTGGL